MFDNNMELLSFILSVIGAGAWIPIIVSGLLGMFQKLYGVLIEANFIYNSTLTRDYSLGETASKSGTVIILAINFVLKHKSYLVNDFCADIMMKNGHKFAHLKACSNIHNFLDGKTGKAFYYDFPAELNLKICPLLQSQQDNTRIICFLLENIDKDIHVKLDDIDKITLKFNKKLYRKNVQIIGSSENRFNKVKFLSSFVRESKK